MDYTWSALIERAKNNDQQAFYELYQKSYDSVYRTVKSMVKDEDTALDIVQDTFVKAFDNLYRLEKPENFPAWIKRIAVNKAKDWFKKKHEISFSQLSNDEDYVPDFEDDRVENLPEAVIDRNETARLIEEILGTLSDEQRIAIGMYYYQNMSVAEIAQLLDVSENTVKSRLNYGRKKIKAGVEELEKEGTKLYGLAPLPFLRWLFKGLQAQTATSGAPTAMYGKIIAETASQASATATSTVSSATVSASGSAPIGASASNAASTGASAIKAGVSATGKAAGGLFSSLGAKIIAGTLAVTLAVGGIGGGVYYATHRDNASNKDTSIVGSQNEESAKTPESEESEALSFKEFNKVFKIGSNRGVTNMIISESGDYQLHSRGSNGADIKPYECWETGKFGNLKQLEDGSYEAKVLKTQWIGNNEGTDGNTHCVEGNIVHFYPAGTSADVLDDNIWIGSDKASVIEEDYIQGLERNELIDANGNFNQYVIWMEGDDAAFTATDTPNDDEGYFVSELGSVNMPEFYDWETLDYLKTQRQTDDDRIVFSGVINEYNDYGIISLLANDDIDPYSFSYDSGRDNAYQVIVLDVPQTMKLHSGSGDGFRSDEVLMIRLYDAKSLKQYYGRHVIFSINPNKTYWPTDASMPLGQPNTSDVIVLN